MLFEPNNIISRIEWCRLQQQHPSVTREEREGWQAEEAGLVDALFGRDRTAFIRAEHPFQLTPYQRGFEDGQALLSFQQVNFRWHYAPGDTVLEALEEDARGAKKGLWADPQPVPPWEWQKRTR